MSEDTGEVEGLLEKLRNGETEAFSTLFARERDRLWRMIHFRLDPRLRGRVDADDVLQETWLAASQRLEHWLEDPSKSFFVWLRLVAMQTLIDVHRRHLGARMRDASLEVSLGGPAPRASSASLAGHLLGRLTSPSGAAMRAEAAARIQEALDALDPIDREVLVLRHFEELTNNEVAELLGMKKSATSNRYVRALVRLKGILQQIPGLIDDQSDGPKP